MKRILAQIVKAICPECGSRVDIPVPKSETQDVVLDRDELERWYKFIETLNT